MCRGMKNVSTICPSILYLFDDTSLNELMIYTKESLVSLNRHIYTKYMITSPLWLMLHDHPDFETLANEHLDATYRAWGKSSVSD